MRLLLLVIYYPPDPDPTGHLMHQVASGLVERGHQVTVVTTPADGGRAGREEQDGVRIVRLPALAKERKGSLAERGLTYASFSALAGVAPWLAGGRPDVVMATNGGFATGLSAWLAGLGRRTVFNVQDIYPQAAVNAGKLRPGPLLSALERVERLMYRLSDVIVVNAEAAGRRLRERGVAGHKIEVISNFVDVDAVRPGPRRNGLSTELGLDAAFVVGYAGNIGWAYDWPLVLDVAKRLRHRGDIRFLVVGDGVAKAETVAAAQAQGLGNLTFLPFQPRSRLGEVRAATDVQIIPYRPGAAQASMASKLYEIMASGRPVWAAAEADTDLARLVADTDCGVVTAPGDPAAAAAALSALADDQERRRRLSDRGRAAAVARFSREAAVDAWERLFCRLSATT